VSASSQTIDLAIVGGGLAGGMIALALAEERPDLNIRLIEEAETLGGNHVWSFFDGDLDSRGQALVTPMVARHWNGHDVRFPAHARTLAMGYNSVTSDYFDAHLRVKLGNMIRTCAAAAVLTPNSVILTDGTRIDAEAVIDARGSGDLSALACGYQKFVGRMLVLAAPHGLVRPVIMDATVDQEDGYRFVYLLPFGPSEIFVEDTYYSLSPGLDLAALDRRIHAYAAGQGWSIESISRHETGVLPVLTGGDFDSFWPADDPVARAGVRGALFHPTTGYSLPDAVAIALDLAKHMPIDGAALARFSRTRARRLWRTRGFYRLLDRMLFHAAEPAMRYRIFERFYRLPIPLIARFYAGRTTHADRLRILCGRPPVPIRSAMQAIIRRD
jgi:lycopene beta-cyclase